MEKVDIPFCQRGQLRHSSCAYWKESLFVVFYLYNIWRIRKFLSQKSAETLIHAFATSQLRDYCKSLLYGLLDCSLNKLQREQNACARRIFNEHKFCHITPLVMKLHGLPAKFRTEFKMILGTFKILHCLPSSYIYQFTCDVIWETQMIVLASFKSKPTLGDRAIDSFNLSAAPKL